MRRTAIKPLVMAAAVATSIALLAGCSAKPLPEAKSGFEAALATGRVLEGDGFLAFQPAAQLLANQSALSQSTLNQRQAGQTACFIFYPGGLVDKLAYAPLLERISDAGYPSYLLSLPMDLAVLSMGAAEKVKTDSRAQSQCSRFVISGHSLGGVAAAQYAGMHPDDALLLLASYPQQGKSIVSHPAATVSVFASNDGLTTLDDIASSRALMPASTEWIEIKGGNHAQFGWYGEQKGDGKGEVSREAQQAIVLQAALALLAAG